LVNHDILTVDSGIKHNTSEKWGKEIMGINLEFAHNMWLERNKSEHDEEGQPENRKKEKLVEIIRGKYEKVEDLYDANEMEVECLMVMPVANLQMMEKNIKNEKKRRWKNKRNRLLQV
jgi:hypothetical protein